MGSRLNIIKRRVIPLVVMGMILMGCQDTIPSRGLIDDASQTAGGTSGTTTGGATPVVKRPDGAVKFKTDFCGCKDGAPITYGNCVSFCAQNKTTAGTLFINFNVTEDISLNTKLKNLNGWCNTPLEGDVATSNPRCSLRAKDENNNEVALDDIVAGSTPNSLKVNIDALTEEKAYVLTLYETSSGGKSDSIQILKFTTDIPLSTLGPLRNAPITQYSCIYRASSQDNDTGELYYDAAFRVHYYFLPRIPPNPIPVGSPLACHNWMDPLYGPLDDILYPRLEQIAGVFNLWDINDPRFFDNNGNSNDDVNDIIIQKAKNFGATTIPAATKFFMKFPVITSDQSTTTAGGAASTAQSMGYFMPPWIDQTTYRSYCLNSTHYNSSNPLFKALRDIVGVDMEGIYVGVKAGENAVDRSGAPVVAPTDFLFIRETDLKKIWFYFKNNVPTVPTDANVSQLAVWFYYPPNYSSPYVKSTNQKLYQLKGAQELGNSNVADGGTNSTGSNSNIPPHDKKFGCIPKF